MNYFEIGPMASEKMSLKFVFFSIFSFGGHFVQLKGTILTILVGGHLRNISVELF